MARSDGTLGPDGLDFRAVKHAALALPEGDPLRDALLLEPDVLPIESLPGKLATYLLLLARHANRKT